MKTETTITGVSLKHATVGGREVPWGDLIRAAVQDTAGAHCLGNGALAWPNDEHATGEAYRTILRDALPLIDRERKAAYEDYCGRGVTSRGSDGVHAIGHGSWVSGPDPDRQATWQAWERLAKRIAAASRGRYERQYAN